MQNTCPSMKKAANNQYSINNYGAESTYEEAAIQTFLWMAPYPVLFLMS
jgi:hypothetical protein